uniref:Chemosensory protein n=1 Tax=Conogethes punctiferalis TaxID=1133088 RepID=A0A2H4G2R7_CONPF|nr:chemosensory protein [Conogethes punctiferalis]
MKFLVLACVVALAGVVSARAQRGYTEIYDTIDLEEVLGNKRLLIPYLQCVLGEGKCTPPGRELKSHIKEALETHCAKCSPKQVKGTKRVIGHLINHEAEYWRKLKAMYDPSGQFTKRYENELKGQL